MEWSHCRTDYRANGRRLTSRQRWRPVTPLCIARFTRRELKNLPDVIERSLPRNRWQVSEGEGRTSLLPGVTTGSTRHTHGKVAGGFLLSLGSEPRHVPPARRTVRLLPLWRRKDNWTAVVRVENGRRDVIGYTRAIIRPNKRRIRKVKNKWERERERERERKKEREKKTRPNFLPRQQSPDRERVPYRHRWMYHTERSTAHWLLSPFTKAINKLTACRRSPFPRHDYAHAFRLTRAPRLSLLLRPLSRAPTRSQRHAETRALDRLPSCRRCLYTVSPNS